MAAGVFAKFPQVKKIKSALLFVVSKEFVTADLALGATNRRVLALQTAKWGMVPQDSAHPEDALRPAPGQSAG